MKGNLMQIVKDDMAAGPDAPHHAMACVASLMYSRYQAGAAPIALVSMDNCSHNGEKLRQAVLDVAQAWCDAIYRSARAKHQTRYLYSRRTVGLNEIRTIPCLILK